MLPTFNIIYMSWLPLNNNNNNNNNIYIYLLSHKSLPPPSRLENRDFENRCSWAPNTLQGVTIGTNHQENWIFSVLEIFFIIRPLFEGVTFSKIAIFSKIINIILTKTTIFRKVDPSKSEQMMKKISKTEKIQFSWWFVPINTP